MKLDKLPFSSEDVVNSVKTKKFDPTIDSYIHELIDELYKFRFINLPNQYSYFVDLYSFDIHYLDDSITQVLGYEKNEINLKFIYDIIHPADRLLIYRATIKSIYYAHQFKALKTFGDNFNMDFRVQKKNGEYIRVLRSTGVAVKDRQDNMAISYAFNTDISHIKTSNVIGFDYQGDLDIQFPDEDLIHDINLFSKSEKRVLYQLVKGKSSKEIADTLCISFHTVESHRKNMLKKSLLNNTVELIVYALEHGVV